MAETGLFKSQSGQMIHMDLPLSEVMAEQVAKGLLTRVDKGAQAATGVSEGAPVAERPAVAEPKANWVGWAVHNGVGIEDAEAMTKAELVDRFGK